MFRQVYLIHGKEQGDRLTDVNLVDFAVGSVDGGFADVRDATVGDVTIGQRKGFEIAVA